MLKKVLTGTVALTATSVLAGKSHDHGKGKLDIVADGNKAQFLLVVPSEAIYGFEHSPKTAKDKEAVKASEDKVTQSSELLVAAPAGCKKESAKFERHQDGSHSDVEVTISFQCEKPVSGQTFEIRYIKEFPRIKALKLQIISGSGSQSGRTTTKAVESITL